MILGGKGMKMNPKLALIALLIFTFCLTLLGTTLAQEKTAREVYEEQLKKWRQDSIALAKKKAEALKSADAETRKKKAYNDGNTFYRKGQYQEALEAYDKAIQADPQYTKAFFCKGNAFKKLRKFPEAIQAYNKAIELDSTYDICLFALGSLYDEDGKFQQAIKFYDKVIKVDPKYFKAYYQKGLAYNKLGENEKAIEALKKATEIKPDYHEAYYLLGRVNLTIARYDDAIKALQEATTISKKYDYFVFLANANNQKGDYQAAITAAQQAQKINVNAGHAYFEEGEAYKGLGRVKDAIASYQKAVKDNRWAQSANYEIKLLQDKK